MVVSVKNRKRKLSSGNSEVPEKVTKQVDDENETNLQEFHDDHEKAEENDVPVEQNDVPVEDNVNELELEPVPVERELKFSRDFKMSEFRQKLRGNTFITELRHFLYLANEKPRIVSKYIEKRGKPLELVEALERVDKSNLQHIAHLCHALQLVIMEVLTNEKTLIESSIPSCRYFLKNHSQLLERLIKSSNRTHRKIALKLSTAIVCLEPQLGRQLLTVFNIISNAAHMNQLMSHSEFDLDQEETVRKCYVDFILSYLIDGNVLLIRNLLDKYELILALISGLTFDNHVTVLVVLSTLKKYVLEFLLISKTKKVHVFDLDVVKQLLRLYNWKGPTYYAASFRKGTKFIDSVDSPEKKAVVECVNEFLILLLSNRKYGVAFDTMSNLKQKKNSIQHKTLTVLSSPWNNHYTTELVINVLRACPELAKGMIKSTGIALLAKRTERKSISGMLSFLSKVITEMSPSIMRSGLHNITLTDFTYWIKDICLSPEVLLSVNRKKLLKFEDCSTRLATTQLLYAMFRQYCNYMNAIIDREKFKGNDLRKFRFDMLDHLFVNFPTVDNILVSVYMSIKDMSTNLLEHLEITIDLIILICKANRSFVDKTSTVIDYLKMLKPLYDSETENPETRVRVELKAIKLILLLDPRALLPNNQTFSNVVESFINAFVLGSRSIQLEAGNLLRDLFLNTKMFDNGILEVDIWLEALKHTGPAATNQLKTLFSEIFTKSHVTDSSLNGNYRGDDLVCGRNLKALFHDIENNVSVQGYVEMPELSKVFMIFNDIDDMTPEVKNYFEVVALLLFHYLPAPRSITKSYSKHFPTFNKYMLAWLDKQKPGSFGDNATIPHFNEMYASILGGEIKFEETFKGTKTFTIDGNNILLDGNLRSDRYILLMIYQICFIVSQLSQHLNFEVIRSNSASHYLVNLLQVLNSLKNTKDESIPTDVSSDEEQVLTSVEHALKYIYCNHLPLLQSFNVFSEEDSDQNFIKFMCKVTAAVNKFQSSQFAGFTVHYRTKIVNQIIAVTNETIRNGVAPNSENIIKVLKVFEMSDQNCMEILVNLSRLSVKSFVLDSSTRSIYFDILVYALNQLASLRRSSSDNQVVAKIGQIYVDMISELKTEINLEKLEDAFYNFLTISHHCIEFVAKEVFLAAFQSRKITKSTIKFAVVLLERREDLTEIFLSNLSTHMNKKELIYPLLDVIFARNIELETKVLNSIYQEYKNGFIKTIEKPQKSAVIYKENANTSVYLIEKCMPASECTDFCKKTLKADAVEVFQLQIIEAIYKKAIQFNSENVEMQKTIFVNYINIALLLFSVVVKREPLENAKIAALSYSIYNWIKTYQTAETVYNFDKITGSSMWQNFCKSCLKFGMRSLEVDGQTIIGCDDASNAQFIKLLAYLCDKFYEAESDHPDPAQLFEMATTHSRFFDIVLAENGSYVKSQLMHLLLTLVRINKQVLDEKHVPIFLGAYQAKLTQCDRYILALLQFYEQNEVNFHKFRPFIWGESAIEHYSLKNEEDKPTLQQEPSILQVMSLVDRQISDNTVQNYPIWRRLNTLTQLPEVKFENPNSTEILFGNTELEKKIESGATNFDEAFLKLCPINPDIYEECYDPAFILPLMSMSFAPEVYSHPVRPVQNGLLGIAFAALSSQDKEMRMAAGCVHLRYRHHFENNKFLDKPLWIQAYDNVQNGLESLQDHWHKHKKTGVPRVPYISGLFLAKAMTTLIDPLSPLYKVLSMYLRVKNTFNFLCVPEFNVLFQSPEIEHHNFRQFIVQIIRDGIKCSSDLFLLVTNSTFKALMGFYNSTMSTLDVNLRILSVINTCVKIPASVKLMVEYVGVITWLNSVIDRVEYFHFDTIEGIISIISNLWYAMKAKQETFRNFTQLEQRLFYLLVKLAPHVSGRISLNNFTKFLNILAKTADGNYKVVTATLLDRIISCAQRHFESHIWYFNNIKEFGSSCIESDRAFCKNLRDQQLDDMSILALFSLRKFVVEWVK